MTTVTGAVGSAPTSARTVPPVPAPVRRGRRRFETTSLAGATLSATFLGLLLGPAAAALGEQTAAGTDVERSSADAASTGPMVDHGRAAQQVDAGGRAAVAGKGGAQVDADLAGLTAVSGEAALATEGAPVASAAATPSDAVETQPGPAAGTATAELGQLALALPEEEGLVLPEVPGEDEDIGDIGQHEDGTDGDDTLVGTDRDDHLDGRDGDDLIYGGAGNDSLVGGNGEDTVYGGTGNDHIDGGNDDDLLYGGAGDDLVEGGAGNDSAFGGVGEDSLYGGGGNDRIDGGTDEDWLEGGTGRDSLVVDDLHDLAIENPWGVDGGGIDTLEVAAGYADSLRAALPGQAPDGVATFVLGTDIDAALPEGAAAWTQQVHPYIENLRLMGDAAHDAVGDERANTLIGNAGDNRLYGGEGDDLLRGGDGEDWLEAGLGADMMYGEAGDDVFVLGLNDSAVDTIFDHSGSNKIVLTGGDASQLTATLVGNDLHLAHAGQALAVLDGYVGHESSFAGIDFGSGLRSFGDFLGGEADMLAEYVQRPDQTGTADDDILQATSGDGQWLEGRGGSDTLLGSEGDDRLEGGGGNDLLRGGNGDDTYVVGGASGGLDRIADTAGRSTIEISGAESQQVGAFMVGRDLWLTVDETPVAVLERHELRPDGLAGVKAGDRMIDPHELMA